LSYFAKNYWFEEKFDIDDFVIVESEFSYIFQKLRSLSQLHKFIPGISPNDAAKTIATAKTQNLASLWDNMEPFFIKSGNLPIYFATLKYDMSSGIVDLIKKGFVDLCCESFLF
jgi:hypothetical protein